MGKKQKMTKGTKIYYGIAAVIIMGLMAYNWHQGGLITIVSSFISIIVAAAIVFALEWLRVSIDIADVDKQIKAEMMALRANIIELEAPTLDTDEIEGRGEVTLDGGMVYFVNVPENKKYKIVISDVKHRS